MVQSHASLSLKLALKLVMLSAVTSAVSSLVEPHSVIVRTAIIT